MTERVRVPSLGAPGVVTVGGPRGHHLARVARVSEGDRVVLFDGAGWQCEATVLRCEGATVVLDAGEPTEGTGPDGARVTWLQGYPKGDKLETVVRQATELGVSAVWPVYTARSVPRPREARADARVERWRTIAEEASRQCGRAEVPEVRAPLGLDEALSLAAGAALKLVAWERATGRLREAVRSAPPGPAAVLVGPEGGLEAAEVERAEARGFVSVSLGPRVWRTETVAPALLAVLSALRGDLSA